MAGVLIAGAPGTSERIPRGSRYRVYAISGKEELLVAAGTGSKSIALDLDPGKYRIKVTRYSQDGYTNVNWGREFLVDMDEATFRKISSLKPKWVKRSMTTDGPRYRCTLPGCDVANMSVYGAVMHEFDDHFKMDPLKTGIEDLEEAVEKVPQDVQDLAQTMAPRASEMAPAGRGPGRPRKDVA